MNVTNSSEQEATPHQQLNSNNSANNAAENEEEPIVTSTSNDHHLSQSSDAHIQEQEQQIDTTITSPARITSSTGNDCSISPPLRQQEEQHQHQQQLQLQQETQQQQQQRNNNRQHYKIDPAVDGSSEDDSRSQQDFSRLNLGQEQPHQKRPEETINVGDGVMPTTSSAAVAAVNNLRKNHLASNSKLEAAALEKTVASSEMVARNLLAPAIADSGGCGDAVVQNAIPAVTENHKIILKLPRSSASTATVETATTTAMSTATSTESQMDVGPTTSNNSTNNSSSSFAPEDTRKVEPLKINLHPTHSTVQQHIVPKITIKPIIQNNTEETDASCSSSADDDPPIPKLTIKAVSTTMQHSNSSTEPHVVPKLTIRSASGEEGSGSAQIATIVPRLTIKMSDSTQSGSTTHNSLLTTTSSCTSAAANLLKSQSSSACSTPSFPQQAALDQAPLPKLTIKTSLDGTSNSIISHISPASLSSSPTSSSTSSCSSTAATATIPKLTIKNIPKPDDLVVPKLTIKTNAAGNSECAATTSVSATDSADDGGASKIPKLTIKTGQEHAVIITQHTDAAHAQSIPKLTIKTKSLDCADVTASPLSNQEDQSTEPPLEKIPKLTIKTHEVQDAVADAPKFCIKTATAIPKLTITVSNVDCGGGIVSGTSSGGPQSPLVVRQLPGPSRKGTATSTSPERVPKLMISRQDSTSSNPILVVSNHSNDAASSENKVVPKLTIKTNSLAEMGESKDCKPTKFTIKTTKIEEEKVPKLTIKTVTPPNASSVVMQQSSEESDECVSLSSCSSPVRNEDPNANNKVVPKLTIKNLCSPQPSVKTTGNMNNIDAAMNTASKKCAKNSAPKNDISVTAKENPASPENVEKTAQQLMTINDAEETIDEAFATVTELTLTDVPPTTLATTTTANGGESSSSQEFCGFNDNTTDSQMEVITTAEADVISSYLHEEEPRRHSDDMDIDDALQQQHAPQIFNNVSHFSTSNGDGDCDIEAGLTENQATTELLPEYLVEPRKHPKLTHVIDTVDLTSSPSPGSSPAQFNYNDNDPPETEQSVRQNDFLLDCLQQQQQQLQQQEDQQQQEQQRQQQLREKSVIQQATTKPYSILLEQLTNHHNDIPALKDTAATLPPPPLQPKPANCILNNSTKYPHLAERLMANGVIHMPPTVKALTAQQQSVIMDSIEILDTPEGSPRSSLDEEPTKFATRYEHHIYNNSSDTSTHQHKDNCKELLSHNNNNNNNNLLRPNHVNLKRHIESVATAVVEEGNLQNDGFQISPNKLRRIENESSTMATITFLTNDHQEPTTVITTSPTMIQNNHCHDISMTGEEAPPQSSPTPPHAKQTSQQPVQTPHRSRKQKHENLLAVPIEEEEDMDPLHLNCLSEALTDAEYPSNTNYFEENSLQTTAAAAAETVTPITVKKRGRPRKNQKSATPGTGHEQPATPVEEDNKIVKSRRVQLLRKRLAIDMVSTEQPPTVLDEQLMNINAADIDPRLEGALASRSERALRTPLRTSRRSLTPNTLLESKGKRNNEVLASVDGRKQQRKKSMTEASSVIYDSQQQFGIGSNSSLSSSIYSSASSMSSKSTIVATMASQIDLTMSSTSSSSSSTTVTTVEAGGSRHTNNSNSMLPPTTILSSSDPLVDVVFKPNDFSSLVAVQQLQSPVKSRRTSVEEGNLMLTPTRGLSRKGSRTDSQDEEVACGSGADNSGDDSASSSSTTTPGRGRGRGRGRSSGRGSGGTRGARGARLGRGASALAKSIAMNRPRCVGGLKHMPDPERLKGLFSPAPQVFEEDTRMSADLSQTSQPMELSQSAKQLDFLTNDESQSSVISNGSILDPNNMIILQNGTQIQKRPKKKKMEVCVAEEEFTVASIAEYDWPPPKGCCPSKNRDTFMIQEQVAMYLGIKSFKRKYPDLPRRQVDMEERNWLQEKGLVSEKMCDLGITAVWASDILDIMYTDFYEKYEEYKDFIRQKHVREIETKQKALGLNVNGRGLQARDRAMLSASKWNAYFNKSRKEERNTCLDLQTLTVNLPLPADAQTIDTPVSEIEECLENNTTQLNLTDHRPSLIKYMSNGSKTKMQEVGSSYPLALVPGQYCDKYRHYTALELRSFPINTVLDDPRTLHARLHRLSSRSQVSSGTDTESATETNIAAHASQSNDPAVATITLPSNKHRLPVRRSRRARTNATSTSTTAGKTKFDIKIEQHKSGDDSSSDEEYSDYSTSSSSETSGSSSDTDSDSDTCCSSANEEESLVKCGVCQHSQNRNLKNLPEVFIKCYTCRRRVHPSCVEMPHRMVSRVLNYNWQCAECKCCIKCKRKQDQNKMLFCEQCDRGFHIYCMDIKTVPDGRWSCERCSVCIRCGATKPEGLPPSASTSSGVQQSQVKQTKHKKFKWINEYRIDHITKLREHCSMLCVPCGRAKTASKRYTQNSSCGNVGGTVAVTSTVNSQMSPPPAPCSVNSKTIA